MGVSSDTTFSANSSTGEDNSATGGGAGDALTSNPLSQFAATTSAQLRGVLSDETGTGAAVFADSPTLVTPNIGAATGSSLVLTQGTIGNAVQTLKSTATNDDPTEEIIQGRVATTDATPTNMITVAIPANTIVALEGRCVARRTGGSAGVAEDGAYYHIEAVFQNIAGTATVITSVSSVTARESQAAWNCTFATSGSDVLMRVTGAANNDVTWHGHLRKMMVSS